MADASYERQHLAVHAAGFINSDGSTQTTFGCTMTRVAAGVYAMVLDANSGVVNDESFSEVTVKSAVARCATVADTSNLVKTITVTTTLATNIDDDIEVILFKSVTR